MLVYYDDDDFFFVYTEWTIMTGHILNAIFLDYINSTDC